MAVAIDICHTGFSGRPRSAFVTLGQAFGGAIDTTRLRVILSLIAQLSPVRKLMADQQGRTGGVHFLIEIECLAKYASDCKSARQKRDSVTLRTQVP